MSLNFPPSSFLLSLLFLFNFDERKTEVQEAFERNSNLKWRSSKKSRRHVIKSKEKNMELNCSLSSIDCVLTFCLQLIVISSSLCFNGKKWIYLKVRFQEQSWNNWTWKKWRTRESQLDFFSNLFSSTSIQFLSLPLTSFNPHHPLISLLTNHIFSPLSLKVSEWPPLISWAIIHLQMTVICKV